MIVGLNIMKRRKLSIHGEEVLREPLSLSTTSLLLLYKR